MIRLEEWKLGFQDSGTKVGESIISLHNEIMYNLIVIIVTVVWIIKCIIRRRIEISLKYMNHGKWIELIWTISPDWWCRKLSICRGKLSNSGDSLKLLVPNYFLKGISGWINYSCMVISQKIKETKMGYRGSKSDTVVSVKEQRVDGSYCKYNKNKQSLQLRCTLMDFERNYQVKILSNQTFQTQQYSSMINSKLNLRPWFITGFTDAEGTFSIDIQKGSTYTGWQVTSRYKITLHIKDKPILEDIRSYFGGIGKITEYKETVS